MGKSTVFANGQGISSTDSDAVSISGPDICRTQVGPIVVPIPYINIAKSASLSGGSTTVKVNGGMAAIDGCCYKTSTGDEPGDKKGIVSGTTEDKAEFINYSFDVKIEGKGVCRNADPMTHNNKNAIGPSNQDSSASKSTTTTAESLEPTTFRFTVVEHISWDSYDEEKQCFIAGHENNKPIAGRKFKIKMPDGSVIEKTTDENGAIELTNQETTAKFEVIFEPGSAESNSKHNMLYNRSVPANKKL